VSRDRLVLEAATPDDLAALVELEKACSQNPWSESAFDSALRAQAGSLILVLRRTNGHEIKGGARRSKEHALSASEPAIVAFCILQTVADELHVHNLCVHPKKRRRGLGRWLLVCALDFGARRGARRAFLEVRSGNAQARRLYSALGFRCIARRADYYSQPVEDALILEKCDLSNDNALTYTALRWARRYRRPASR
jgi:ribosomal-protein-alanine N-acetyltransferase